MPGTATIAWIGNPPAGGIDMSYTIPIGIFSPDFAGPADSTTFWLSRSLMTDAAWYREASKYPVPIAGTVTKVAIKVEYSDGNKASNENITFSLHLNGASGVAGASTSLGTMTWDTDYGAVAVFTCSLAVIAGDLLAVKLITPAWATNPTSVNISGLIYVEA